MSGRQFAVFDIDGTLIRWQLYHAMIDNLVKLGFVAPGRLDDIKKARMVWKRRESKDSFRKYELELVKIYDDILQEINFEQFQKAAKETFDEYKDQVYTYTRDLLKALKTRGYLLFAISGSQKEIIGHMASYYGFDDYIAKEDLHKAGLFTGETISPIHNKDETLRELVKRNGAIFKNSIAVGDSASDIKMLEIVERPIAFNPEAALFKHARSKGWEIIIERKNIAYQLKSENGRYILAKAD